MVWCWWLIHMWILWFNIVWRGELCIDSLLCLLLTLFYLIWLFIHMMLSIWSAVQSCSWDERIVSVQFKEEMNIWSRATFAITTHNNQPPTLRLGEEDTSYKQIAIVCNNTASFWLETWAWMCIRKSTQRIELKNNDNSQLWDWQRQYTIEGRISLIPITQPYLDSSCNEICKWKRVDWNNILREQDNLRCGHRRGEIALT